METNKWCFRQLYRNMELPGKNEVKDAHEALDTAVRKAYGLIQKQDILEFLLELNTDVAAREAKGEKVVGPGLPPSIDDPNPYISSDCIAVSEEEHKRIHTKD
jgi:hypothetical protein